MNHKQWQSFVKSSGRILSFGKIIRFAKVLKQIEKFWLTTWEDLEDLKEKDKYLMYYFDKLANSHNVRAKRNARNRAGQYYLDLSQIDPDRVRQRLILLSGQEINEMLTESENRIFESTIQFDYRSNWPSETGRYS